MESSYLGAFLLGTVIYLFICGGIGVYVANQKGRGDGEGFWFGILFGPIGILIVACLPDMRAAVRAAPAQAGTSRPVPYVPNPDAAANMARRLEAERLQWQEEEAGRRAEAERRRAGRQASKEARDAERVVAMQAKGIEPGSRWAWFHVLPDVAQIAIVAAALAVPAVAILIIVVGR